MGLQQPLAGQLPVAKENEISTIEDVRKIKIIDDSPRYPLLVEARYSSEIIAISVFLGYKNGIGAELLVFELLLSLLPLFQLGCQKWRPTQCAGCSDAPRLPSGKCLCGFRSIIYIHSHHAPRPPIRSPSGRYLATGTMAGAVDLSFSTTACLEVRGAIDPRSICRFVS